MTAKPDALAARTEDETALIVSSFRGHSDLIRLDLIVKYF